MFILWLVRYCAADSPVWVRHLVDHGGRGQDQDVVLAWCHLDPVSVPDPEPPLGDFRDPVPVSLNRVLVVDDIALDVQVRAVNLDDPALALRCDHGLLDHSYAPAVWI